MKSEKIESNVNVVEILPDKNEPMSVTLEPVSMPVKIAPPPREYSVPGDDERRMSPQIKSK